MNRLDDNTKSGTRIGHCMRTGKVTITSRFLLLLSARSLGTSSKGRG